MTISVQVQTEAKFDRTKAAYTEDGFGSCFGMFMTGMRLGRLMIEYGRCDWNGNAVGPSNYRQTSGC